MFWRRPVYLVSLDSMRPLRDGGFANYLWFKDKKAALQCFKRNPKHGQIDVRGHRVIPHCWMYWHKGRIIVQGEPK